MQSLYTRQEVAWIITSVKCPTVGFKLQREAFLQEPGAGAPWGLFQGPFLQCTEYGLLGVLGVHCSHGNGWLQPLQRNQGIYIPFPS